VTRAVLASDLDRTLIYPARTLPKGADALVVEYYNGRGVSVASSATVRALRELASYDAFVPVTTRSRKQLERITPVWSIARNGWAICANGFTLLDRGVEDAGWKAIVDAGCAESAPLDEAREVFEREIGSPETVGWMHSLRHCDDRFLFTTITRTQAPPDLESIAMQALAPLHWRAVWHGRKLYALPAALGKGPAAAYLRERLEIDVLLSAGDSVLDIGLLESADVAWCPRDAEIVALDRVPEGSIITDVGHVFSAQQIAEAALDLVRAGAPGDIDAAAK